MSASRTVRMGWTCLNAIACVLAAAAVPAAETAPETAPAPDEAPQSAFPAPAAPGVPSLQMSTDYASPALAIGTYRPVGQMQSGALRVAPFTVRAGIHSGLGYDDNVTLTSTNKVSSVFLAVSPSVAVGLEGATRRYYVTYRGSYGRFFSSSIDNYEDHNIALSAANDWTARLRTLALYEHVRGHDPRGSTTANLARPEEWRVNAVRGTVSYGAEGAQGRLEGNAGFFTKKFDAPRPAGVARDYDQTDLGGAFSYRLAPKTRAVLEVRRAEIEHESDPQLDSSEMRYLIGATWDATANTSGRASVGYMTKEVDNPLISDFSAPTYEIAITWLPLIYSRVELNARRTFNEALEVGSSFVVDNFISLGWIHTWAGGIQSTVGYTYDQQKHEGLGRTDTFHGIGLKASYAVRRNVRLGAEFRHDLRNSPVPALEFRRNLTLFTVEGAL